MKKIPLTQGQFALVDDEDFEWLSRHTWHAKWNPSTKSYYAATNIRVGDRFRWKSMHRLIMDDPPGKKVDHKNHDTLDNRRTNLRFATTSQNNANRAGLQKNNTSGYMGVTWHEKTQKWMAQIRAHRKRYHIGLFERAEDAALAYNRAAKELHGEFAYQNEFALAS